MKMSISFSGKLGNHFNTGISFMGTSLPLHDLCSLWSFFGNVNMVHIPPGDLFCVPKNAAPGVSEECNCWQPPSRSDSAVLLGAELVSVATRGLPRTQLLTLGHHFTYPSGPFHSYLLAPPEIKK